MDCLVCHEQSGKYKKFPTACGHPAYEEKNFGGKVFEPVDLNAVAKTVGKPGLQNCGVCHFFGGGGGGVKHGDLDSSLLSADRDLDVHMSKEGANHTCTACHTTINHQMAGRYYTEKAPLEHSMAMPEDYGNRISCESCHGSTPHETMTILDDHTAKVSCQACHIPRYARGGISTLMWWDWSTAGKFTEDCKPIVEKNENGRPTYHTMKGDMTWAENVVPTYAWYNGGMEYVTIKDTLPKDGSVEINRPLGSYDDPESRIFPFKYYEGRQIYDAGANRLVYSKLFGPKGSGAYWSDYDWQRSVEIGMAESGEEFSGQIGFIDTAMYWPITHMVAPKEDSLQCAACHARDGRLASLPGFYLPGRDRVSWIDTVGWSLFVLSIIGVMIHGLLRVVFRMARSKKQ